MKIEKISESQIKVFLNQSDLRERNIKLTELAYGSEKTQALFREMMEEAIETCGFEIEDSPLMIEAIPVSADSIMIIVSKVSEDSRIDNKFNLMPPSREERKFKRNDIKRDLFSDDSFSSSYETQNIVIYSFDNLEAISSLSKRAVKFYSGTNVLYKYNNKYFLAAQNDNPKDKLETEFFELILSEYGRKHISNVISNSFLEEHAEIIVSKDAVRIFSEYM